MHFLVPMAVVFAATIPVVILLYLLKLKRIRTEVSSTILWRRSIEDLMANAPFQRLRRNLLLYLQILILALGTVALMRPFLRWTGLHGRSLIVLIDRSGSMRATDVPPSRLEVAKQQALRLVDGMSRGDRMAVLAFSDHAEVVQSLTDDRAALRSAIADIAPTDVPTRIAAALSIARPLALASSNAEIYIISDGAIAERDLSLDDLQRVAFVGVGERADNLGIVDVELRESFGAQREAELFVGLRNFGENERKATLRLLLGETVVDAKDVAIKPKSAQSAIFRNITATEGLVEIRLDCTDDLGSDNAVRGMLQLKKEFNVALVTQGNYFLERLLALHEDLRVAVVRPADYSSQQPRDLVIFDNWAPTQLTPGNYMFLNAAPPMPGVGATTQPLRNPVIVDWHRLHPLTRHVNFEPVGIQRALQLRVPVWAQVLAESHDAPMIVLLEDQHICVLAIAFGILDSDWPLHISFPVFLSNAVHWLASRSVGESRLTYRTGDTAKISERSGEEQVEILTPDGRAKKLQLDQWGEGFFAATEQAGLYEIRAGDKTIGRFGAALLSTSESNTSPIKTLSFQGRIVESTPGRLRTNYEIWFWLAAAALAVLMIEWLIYCRRSSL